jgi:hypothetical protein
MSRRPRRRRDEDDDDEEKGGAFYIIIGVAILLVFGGVGIWLKMTERPADHATGCPTDTYDSVTVVLIDLTDPINPVQARALRNALIKIRDDTPKFGRLEVYPLESTAKKEIQPLFVGCSPGSGKEVDSRWYGNPELADKEWQKKFASKLGEVIEGVRNIKPADASPLLEGIQSVAVTAFGVPLAAKAKERRIIIISDMIHHTSELSMFQGAPEFEKFKGTPYYLRTKSTLRGAQIDVGLIVRETRKNVQQPKLYQFWVKWVDDSDGYLRDWDPLQ